MEYYLSISSNYIPYKEIKLEDEGYNVFKRTLPLGTLRGKYKSGTYRISRCDGWFTDDYTIQVGLGEKLSKFLSDIEHLRKHFASLTFGDFLKKYPTVEDATSPYDTGFGPSPIFFTPDEHVNVYSDYVQFEFELDKEYRNTHEKADKYALDAMHIVEKIVDEVIRMTPLDFSKFSFRPVSNSSTFRIPQWAAGITKVGVKAFANYLGATISDFDFGGGDSDFNFGGGDSDFDFGGGESDFDFDSDYGTDCSNISFRHAPNDGTYMKTSQDVNIQVAGGGNKGSFDVYLHNGDKYIDFKNQWIKIQGKTRFHLNGNDYIIK